jgi:hypothetical protein
MRGGSSTASVLFCHASQHKVTLVCHVIVRLDGDNFAHVSSIDISHAYLIDAMTARFADNPNLIRSRLIFPGCWSCLALVDGLSITTKSILRSDVEFDCFFSNKSDIMIESREIVKLVLVRYRK